jgi:hypothetical protein
VLADLAKAAGEEDPDPIPVRVQAELAKSAAEAADLKKSNDELKTRLEKAETAMAAAREEASLRKFTEEITGFKDVGLDPAKDAAILKSVEDKVGKEAADRLREIFKSQMAIAKTSRLMGEIGSSGPGLAAADSAAAEVQQKMSDIMSKSDKVDRDSAMNQVFRADPALYDRYRNETLVR